MTDDTPATEDPRASRSRAVIVPAATRHFLANGYLSANLDDIAAEAGVAKRTIYNLYQGKEQLFRAVLDEVFTTAESFATNFIEPLTPQNLDTELESIAIALGHIVTSDPIVRLRRLMIAEAERFPDLAVEYWHRAPGKTLAALAARFAELADKGHLNLHDPRIAAEHFAYLTIGALLDRALLAPPLRADAAAVESAARAGVRAFLQAYRA